MRNFKFNPQGEIMFEKLLTPKQVGALMQVTTASLANSRSTGTGIQIPYSKIGKFVRYKESDLNAYIEANTHSHTGEAKENV